MDAIRGFFGTYLGMTPSFKAMAADKRLDDNERAEASTIKANVDAATARVAAAKATVKQLKERHKEELTAAEKKQKKEEELLTQASKEADAWVAEMHSTLKSDAAYQALLKKGGDELVKQRAQGGAQSGGRRSRRRSRRSRRSRRRRHKRRHTRKRRRKHRRC